MKASPETLQIWAVGQKLWLRDYPGIYEALKKEWSENTTQIMEALKGSIGFMCHFNDSLLSHTVLFFIYNII